jgi:hypothetical protein
MASPVEIKETKLLLVEGADAYYFFIWACQAFGANGIQVLDFGGIKNLGQFLKQLPLLSGYENVESIVIGRDAEQNPEAAVKSVSGALKKARLPVPAKPFEFLSSAPRVAFMLFPGFVINEAGKERLSAGTLEDLCLEIIEDPVTLGCVDHYVDCLLDSGQDVKHLHKTKVHAYLAGKSDFVGLKIGEAARVGAWNWNHSKLELFRGIITGM